jgi:uncharacterized protein YbaA (DUF1428 family)
MKKPILEPCLFFGGRCEEAVEFYESALGAKRVMLTRFDEAPEAAAIWKEHGALEYVEAVGDDMEANEMTSFPDLAGANPLFNYRRMVYGGFHSIVVS